MDSVEREYLNDPEYNEMMYRKYMKVFHCISCGKTIRVYQGKVEEKAEDWKYCSNCDPEGSRV